MWSKDVQIKTTIHSFYGKTIRNKKTLSETEACWIGGIDQKWNSEGNVFCRQNERHND